VVNDLTFMVPCIVKYILLSITSLFAATASSSSKQAWHIPDAVCTVFSSWWWAEKPPETCTALTAIRNIVWRCILLVILKRVNDLFHTVTLHVLPIFPLCFPYQYLLPPFTVTLLFRQHSTIHRADTCINFVTATHYPPTAWEEHNKHIEWVVNCLLSQRKVTHSAN
jgi:hypothetical protein